MTGNLSAIARSYLLSRASQRDAEKSELISNIPQSISSLLKEAVQLLKEFNPLPNMRHLSADQINGVMNRNMWVRYVVKPAVRDIRTIVQAGGDGANDALVRGLYETDPLVKVFSGLVLLDLDHVNHRLTEQLMRAFAYINNADKEMPYYRHSGQFMMFFFVFYLAGDPKAQDIVNNMLRTNNIGFDEQKSRLINTMFEYLFPESGH